MKLSAPQYCAEFSFDEEAQKTLFSDTVPDVHKLILKGKKELALQWEARKKAAEKLPEYYTQKEIFYPPLLSVEQCSSEKTALYKSSLFSGNLFIDLTAGMGVDSYYFSKKYTGGILVEQNENLARITSHNLSVLEANHLQLASGIKAEDFLKEYSGKSDLLYIDPARRDQQGGKVVKLTDCVPNVLDLLPRMLEISDTVLIKTSPLLDITLACSDLKNVANIHVVAVDNECKELLFHIKKGYTSSPEIHCINILKSGLETFRFTVEEEKTNEVQIGNTGKYLYEPNAAVMKAGAFKTIAKNYHLVKLHPNTHLYTSDKMIDNFPGRKFELIQEVKPDKNTLEKLLPEGKANITLRNYPGTVDELRKKLKIKDGGEYYVFGATIADNSKRLFVCKKTG